MKLQTKVYIITAIIFLLHFIVSLGIGQQQIKTEVLENIKDNARNVRGILMAYRSVYQKIFIDRHIQINDTTLELLPAHTITLISKEFTHWVNNGLTFNNVSDRPRNPRNMADKVERDAMGYFRSHKTAQERFVPFINNNGEQYYHFSQPIYIQPLCLKCHGKKSQAPESIQKRYNTAYNYKLGDLRGLMSIKLPSRIIQQRIKKLLISSVKIHLATFLLALLLISFLMNKTIISRIRNLQAGSERLASGDYQTQLNISGNDELSQVGQSFNKIASTIAHREQSLLKQQALYHTLAQTNKSILQFHDKLEFFDNICHIAIAQVHLTLAWIGLLNENQSGLEIVASAGKDKDCLQQLDFTFNNNTHTTNNTTTNNTTDNTGNYIKPAIKAVLDKKVVIINDYLNHDQTRPQHKDAREKNIHAMVAVPILQNQQVIGVFSVYSDQAGFFSQDIVGLLEEMVRDIEYAIGYYDLQQKHLLAQQKLQQHSSELSKLNESMRLLLESTGEGIYGVDIDGRCTFANRAAVSMFGFPLDELLGKIIHILTHHTHKDGRPYPNEDCPVYQAFRTNTPIHINNEVFWRKDGTSFPVEYSTYPIINDKQIITGSVTIFRDVTEAQKITNKMNFLAQHDSLTGLLNRYSFEQRIAKVLESAHTENSVHVACYLDLDQFKLVNDTCGHLAGDEMLKLIAHLLKDNIRKHDILARLGGDEFGLLLEDCTLEQAAELGKKLCLAVKDFRFLWDEKIFNIGVSIGISAISKDSQSVQHIFSDIDSACYIAKENGRNRIHVIEPDDTETAQRHGEMRWVSEIRSALEEDRLVLYQQSIISCQQFDSSKQHFEILIRMLDKEGKLILPGAFLPAAERYNLMLEIDQWVITNTFESIETQRRIRSSSSSDIVTSPFYICSINLSGQSIDDPSLYDFIIKQQNKYHINPQSICFEITESVAITHLEQAINFIHKLTQKGFLFALDDFGTGMSSFAYLKNLPVNYLKIDGSFIKDILDDPIDRAMVKSINEIGHIMGLQTIAEYVENDAIRTELVGMQIDFLQGYGIAHPEPLS